MKTNAFFFSRPWLEMYNVSVRVPRSSGGFDGGGGNSENSAKENARLNETESKILAMLHVDAIFEVLKKLSPRDLVRASSVCKKWHSKSLWRTHCERAFRFFDRDAEETRRRCVELYSNNYKKPRFTNGIEYGRTGCTCRETRT